MFIILWFDFFFSGVLLNEIVDNMKQKRNGTMKTNYKLWVYSAHDTNVAGLLHSLNVYNYKLPPYAAAVFLELRKSKNSNNTYVVTVSQYIIKQSKLYQLRSN